MADGRRPDQDIHDGVQTVPRLAATVVLLRGQATGLELLLVRRTPRARFMAGAWVFPGGAVDAADGDGPDGLRAAAIREVAEEAGIELGRDPELVVFSHWITPARARIRYDTWFYLTTMPSGQEPRIDGEEIIDARWLTPADALAAAEREEISIVFPTRRQLERLAGFDSADALLAHSRRAPVRAVVPQVIGEGEQARIVLPGEPGYAE